jgi:alkylation response protein AidB-like acyl-CoA dehydrogenase
MHLAFPPARSRSHAAHTFDAYAAFDPLAAAADLAASLNGARARQQRTATPAVREGDWIRASNLLALSIPREHGGGGASWQTVVDALRIVARADGGVARALGMHHLQIATIQLHANPHRRHRLLAASAVEDLIWGDAVEPLDRALVATPVAGGYLLHGTRQLAPGGGDADWLTVSAWDPLARAPLVAVLPTGQPGVGVGADGATVRFDTVLLPEDNVLQAAAQRAAVRTALRAQVAALLGAALVLGKAESAGRTMPGAAAALTDAAARLDYAFACDADLDGAERAALGAAVARAHDLAHGAEPHDVLRS